MNEPTLRKAILPAPIPPEGDPWWTSAPIADVLRARVVLWMREMGWPDETADKFLK